VGQHDSVTAGQRDSEAATSTSQQRDHVEIGRLPSLKR
jgi:hypothetical protein